MTLPVSDTNEGSSHAAAQDVTVPARLAAIHARIAAAARRAGRAPDAVTLVAVSKFHPSDAVAAAIAAGQRRFGENRVQEARAKFAERGPDIRLHLIGPLQTNKAAEAVRIADVIETIDRPRLADAIAAEADRAGRCPELLVQINIGDEPQKAGVARHDADRFIENCMRRFGDRVRGLMCIPPATLDPSPFFRALASLAGAHGLGTLSMGMSDDLEEAVAAGATELRIGTAIFGPRPP